MTRCWALQASDRPRFQAIADELKSVLESGVIRGFGEFVVFIV